MRFFPASYAFSAASSVHTCEQAQAVAPSPRLITKHDREEHHRRQRRLLIVEVNERAMAECHQRYPQDVADKNAFSAGAILPFGHPGHVPGLDPATYQNFPELLKPQES
ncbi:hypothetical protein D1007_10913 [Hordeum vulgare]|nr:hypothetical protein D1007_10913 [Hordeum vulgare]